MTSWDFQVLILKSPGSYQELKSLVIRVKEESEKLA